MTMQPGDDAQYQTQPPPQPPQQPPWLPAHQAYPPVLYGYGHAQPVQYVYPPNAALAVVASFFLPGLGSMLNEKVGKGIGILARYLVTLASCLVLVGFILAPAVWIWGWVAANGDVKLWNKAYGIVS